MWYWDDKHQEKLERPYKNYFEGHKSVTLKEEEKVCCDVATERRGGHGIKGAFGSAGYEYSVHDWYRLRTRLDRVLRRQP